MNTHLSYLLRSLFPSRLYAYSTKVRIPTSTVDFRKLLVSKYLLKDGGSAIDGGAHIGYHTRYLSEIVGEKGEVWSFEPNPYMFKLLKKYARQKKQISIFQKALSDQTAHRVTFYVTPYSLLENSTLEEGLKEATQKKVEVETIKIDDLPVSNLKLIKLDVEGHELSALAGAQNTISQFHPWIIFEYSHNKHRNGSPLLSFLKDLDYVCFDLETLDFLTPEATIEITDAVAFPKDRKQEAITFLKSLAYY